MATVESGLSLGITTVTLHPDLRCAIAETDLVALDLGSLMARSFCTIVLPFV